MIAPHTRADARHTPDPSAAATRPRSRFAALLAAACLIALAQIVAFAQSRAEQRAGERIPVDGPPAPADEESLPSNSTIRGRVVFEESGRPARRTRLMLFEERASPHSGSTAAGVTDARGGFEFKHVRAGKYIVAVFAPGVLTPLSFLTPADLQQQGVRDLGETKKYLDEIAVDGRTDVEVTVKAKRGAAISGRITYDDGAPAVSATVSLLRRKDGQLLRVLAAEQADDRGVYRFKGLPPGEYVVVVSELVVHGDQENGRTSAMATIYGGTGLALFATYYPGVTSPDAATPVRVEAGQEREGVDLSIAERELHTLSGVVRTRGGRAVAGARLYIAAAGAPKTDPVYGGEMPDAIADAAGRFTLREIPDGDYVLNVKPTPDMDIAEVIPPAAQPKPKPSPQAEADDEEEDGGYRAPLARYTSKRLQLKVAGQDIDNYEVVLSDGAIITGTITVEGGKGVPDYADVSAVRAGGAQGEGDGDSSYLEGQFAVGGLAAGSYYLNATATGEDGEYYLKSITYNGVDLTREPLRVADGAQVKGVRVVLAVGSATLQGRVFASAADRGPAPEAHLVVAPADQTRWRLPGYQHHEFADLTGKFSLELPPGDYVVFVLPPGAGQQPLGEAEMRERAATAKRVTLRAGQQTTLELNAPGDK